jgi:hypothetical protein
VVALPSVRPSVRRSLQLLLVFVGAVLAVVAPQASWAQEPVIKLLDAGSGDKIELRVTPKKGATESFEMLMDMDMAMDMGGMGKIPQTLPQMKMLMNATVTDVSGDAIQYDFELAEATVDENADPMMVAALKPELAKMVGTKGSVVVSNRGVTKSAKISAPEGTSKEELAQFDNMQKSMNHASAPFPEEAVGVGAKWTVTTDLKENGIQMTQVVTYTLDKIEGRTITLSTALVQNAENQPVAADSLPPGSEATLSSLQSTGTGMSVIDLDHLFPTKGQLKHDMTTRMEVSANGQKMGIGMDMKLGLDMARK